MNEVEAVLSVYQVAAILTGDARELGARVPDRSVALIFCDPPYLKQYLPLYDWLGEFAARVLTPDGFLLTYAGTYWQDEVMARLRGHLSFFWNFYAVGRGPGPVMWRRRVVSKHKSILAYRLHDSQALPRCNVLSVWCGSGQDKRYHVWGQDESTARYYLDCFSKPGDLVLDPFCGGGTTVAMARLLGRRALAFEIDPDTAEIARARVAQVQPFLPGVAEEQLELEEVEA